MSEVFFKVIEKCDHDPRVFEMYRNEDRFMCEVYVDHHQYDRPHCYLEIKEVQERGQIHVRGVYRSSEEVEERG